MCASPTQSCVGWASSRWTNSRGDTMRVNWQLSPGRADLVESRIRENRTYGSGREGDGKLPHYLHRSCRRDLNRRPKRAGFKSEKGKYGFNIETAVIYGADQSERIVEE